MEEFALAKIAGKEDSRIKVEWPFKKANDYLTEIMPHELACIGARPKYGKSSIALQMTGHNLKRGLRIAYFTLETDATSAFSQIASQIAGVNWRNLWSETKEKQDACISAIRWLRNNSDLAIFDRDMSMSGIEARCRLLKSTMNPNLVIIDHLHQIQNDTGKSSYEKLTDIALRMVELRKKMDCAVILCLQLNRGSEHEDRPPRASDSRDSGAIEAAAHRMVLLHRPHDDFSGMAQTGPEVGQRSTFDYYFMQELMRDGPTGTITAKFHATKSLFTE